MAANMIVNGKSYEDYLAEMKAKNGVLLVKRGRQIQNLDGMKIENNYHDSTIIPCDSDTLILGEAVLEKDGKQVELNGRIEFKGGVWYENGNKIKI